jgi:glycosyltransferase involved in cell wall biosynthesis
VAESDPGLISLVVPVYNEADNILPLLEALMAGVASNHETLLVYDFDDDTTLPPARESGERYDALRLVKNNIGPGVLNALKTGLGEAKGDVVIVTMADLSDDVSQIDEMASRVRSGDGVVAASRYVRGGRQVGGPFVKSTLSRLAGLSLRWLTGIETHDATNNYKAYNHELLQSHSIESDSGFELGLELTVKAYLSGFPISEIPTTWRDRTAGESRFRVLKWMPGYLRWYIRALVGSWTGRARRARRARSHRIRSSPPRSADVSTE